MLDSGQVYLDYRLIRHGKLISDGDNGMSISSWIDQDTLCTDVPVYGIPPVGQFPFLPITAYSSLKMPTGFSFKSEGKSMSRKRFVDLSISIEPELPSDPPMMIPKVDYVDHELGATQMQDFFPGIEKEQLPGGMGWAVEFITLTTHSGTHLDAPYHYHPTMDNGV